MQKHVLFSLLTVLLILSGCLKNTGTEEIDFTGKYVIPFTTRDTVLFATGTDGIEIPIAVSIPTGEFYNFSGMVVLHGSGGNWKDSDTDDDGIADEVEEWTLSSQNRVWKNAFDDENVVSAFPSSFYRRGTVENEGEWKNPPLQFDISASFVRNRDAYLTLDVLRNLVWENGLPIVNSTFIGLLGFSHGGTAVQSTIYDNLITPVGWTWTQVYSGKTYSMEIKSPTNLPPLGGFRAAVMYYPGSYHNGYYGNTCNETGIYSPYINFMIHLPSEDPLTANSTCLINYLGNRGIEPTVFTYEGANHGFDGATNGPDAEASTIARDRTMTYLRAKLGF